MWLKAFTWRHEGQPSRPPLTAHTDTVGPSEPHVTNITCKDDHSLYLEWDKPETIRHSVDLYRVIYSKADRFDEDTVLNLNHHSQAFKERRILLTNLTAGAVYRVRVVAATASLFDVDLVFDGESSPEQRVLLRRGCDLVKASSVLEGQQQSSQLSNGGGGHGEVIRGSAVGDGTGALQPLVDLGTGVIAGVALVAMAIMLAVVAVAIKRKFRRDSLYYISEADSGTYSSTSGIPLPAVYLTTSTEDTCTLQRSEAMNPKISLKPVPVNVFLSHVDKLKRDPDGFSREFRALQNWEERRMAQIRAEFADSDVSKNEANRYSNVVAFEHTRVKLRPLKTSSCQKKKKCPRKSLESGLKHSPDCSYINANYVDGSDCAKAYIATQAPLPASFGLFWRMIWENSCGVIVMVANLVENGRSKCDRDGH